MAYTTHEYKPVVAKQHTKDRKADSCKRTCHNKTQKTLSSIAKFLRAKGVYLHSFDGLLKNRPFRGQNSGSHDFFLWGQAVFELNKDELAEEEQRSTTRTPLTSQYSGSNLTVKSGLARG